MGFVWRMGVLGGLWIGVIFWLLRCECWHHRQCSGEGMECSSRGDSESTNAEKCMDGHTTKSEKDQMYVHGP
jgi:hypothetical protein